MVALLRRINSKEYKGMLAIPAGLIFNPVGELSLLSNFSGNMIHLDGVYWPTVEHYFQAQKFADERQRDAVRQAPTPWLAKKRAWEMEPNHLRHDWERVRQGFMLRALEEKFRQSDARDMLLRTWPLPIYEDSMEDSYWGIGPNGAGVNLFGLQLVQVRAEICGADNTDLLPLLRERPTHQSGSRYQFIIGSNWVTPSLMRDGGLSVVRTSALTTICIPELLANQIRKSGIIFPDDGVSVNLTQPATLIQKLQRANPSKSGSDIIDAFLFARRAAYDKKYSKYQWDDDARALVPDWPDIFKKLLADEFGAPPSWRPCVVVGAGSAEEAKYIWASYGKDVVLTALGPRLVANCREEAPACCTIEAAAENLAPLTKESMGLYCALRTYESVYFDRDKAIAEARRVLRPGGGIVISVSDAYRGPADDIVRGRLTAGMKLDLSAAARDIADIATRLQNAGFTELKIVDLKTEWAVLGQKAATDLSNPH